MLRCFALNSLIHYETKKHLDISNHSQFNGVDLCILCPKILTPYILTIFNKNTYTCEIIAIEIDEMEDLKNIFINTVSFLTKKVTVTKTDVLRTYIMGNVNSVHLFFIWKSLGMPRTFF